MQYRNTTSPVSARARQLGDAEATSLGVKLLELLARKERRAGVVTRVTRAISSVRHQSAGAVDAAAILARVSPDDTHSLTAGAAQIVHGSHNGGLRC